jgi:hypothetical protein
MSAHGRRSSYRWQLASGARRDSADVVWLLALDSAPARLGSWIFAGYRGDLMEPAEDRDASEAADSVASDSMGDQDCL